MTAVCSLGAGELAAQLDRYRTLGHRAAVVDYEPGRVVVRFAGDPPKALIDRTLEVERGCCPFFEIDYQPDTQLLVISVDQPDRRPSLEAIFLALRDSAADLLPDSTLGQMRTAPGAMSCCSPSALETCCEARDKHECCGPPLRGERTDAAPSRCG